MDVLMETLDKKKRIWLWRMKIATIWYVEELIADPLYFWLLPCDLPKELLREADSVWASTCLVFSNLLFKKTPIVWE